MVTQLEEMQFEILPTEDALEGYAFGIGREVSIDEEGFIPGAAEWMTQDQTNGRRGNVGFGRDVLGAPIWAWQPHLNTTSTTTALAALSRFAKAWRPVDLVKSPSAVTAIRYRVGDRTRRVYGRPRRFEGTPSNLLLSGFMPIDCDFQNVDAQTYDDIEDSVTLALASGSEGGFIFPASMPISTLPSSLSTDTNQAVVGGTARAYPRIRFNGPWTTPTLITDDWTLTLNTAIPDGDWIEVDTRPWKLTVLRSDGSSAAGALSRRVWLEDLNFAPDTRPELAIGGSSAGAATCTVSWRNAHDSL